MIAVASDLHLCPYVWRGRRDLYGDSYRALNSMKERMLHEWKCSKDPSLHVILAGDIFDEKKVDGATLKAFTDFVDDLYSEGVAVYFVQGNHDLDAIEPVASIQGAESIHRKKVILDGLSFYGLDWQPKTHIKEAVESVPECDYLVLHQMFEHLVHFEAAADLCLDDIPAHVKNVIVGDVHKADITPIHGSGVCISPGPLHPCSVDQPGPHGFYMLKEGGTAWERCLHENRRIHRFLIEDTSDIDKLEEDLKKIPENILHPIFEIRYPSDMSDKIEYVCGKCENVKFFLKPSASSMLLKPEDVENAKKELKELTLESSLSIVCDPEEEKETYNFVLTCLSGDTDNAIRKVLGEYETN